MTTQLWEIGLVVFSTLFSGSGPILIKKGMDLIKKIEIKKIITNWYLYLGIFLYGVSYLMTIPALKNGDLSILYPIISLSYIWVCLLSMKYLKERMNIHKWIGIVLIILGVTFIGLGI